MKKLSWFNKIVYFLNILLALGTFAGYLLPFLAPRMFPLLSVLTLGLPLLLMCNILFFFYWLLMVRKQIFLSAVVLLVGIGFVSKWYKFSPTVLPPADSDFTLMSYNVRLFNKYKWLDRDSVLPDIIKFIDKEDPDILCIQEFSDIGEKQFPKYKYSKIFYVNDKNNFGQAIFSKFPIIDKGAIRFEDSNNNAVFADIVRGKDTLRIYSMHLQSMSITKEMEQIETDLDQKKTKHIYKKISEGFAEQQEQARILAEHKNNSKYPVIICGDMNNSAFSYVYRSIKGNLNDGFEQAGKGFGKTYHFKYYPARIDYVFYDKSLTIKEFRTISKEDNSDHHPIMARFK